MNSIGMAIESMVAVLLLLTILYCVRLNTQLRLLKADEHSLKATIGELITATEIAERAIAGLRLAANECDSTLTSRFGKAELLSSDLERQITAGDELVRRLAGIVAASRPGGKAPAADTKSMVAAASAFAERANARVSDSRSVDTRYAA